MLFVVFFVSSCLDYTPRPSVWVPVIRTCLPRVLPYFFTPLAFARPRSPYPTAVSLCDTHRLRPLSPLKRATFLLASVPSNGSTTCTHTRPLSCSPRISFLRHPQRLTLAVNCVRGCSRSYTPRFGPLVCLLVPFIPPVDVCVCPFTSVGALCMRSFTTRVGANQLALLALYWSRSRPYILSLTHEEPPYTVLT